MEKPTFRTENTTSLVQYGVGEEEITYQKYMRYGHNMAGEILNICISIQQREVQNLTNKENDKTICA